MPKLGLVNALAGGAAPQPANKISTAIDQQKLSPELQQYLLTLCTSKSIPNPYIRSIVVPRAQVLPKLAEIWPGEANQHAKALWSHVDEIVQAHPIEDVTNDKFHLKLSFAQTRLEPEIDPARKDHVSVATIDGTTGLMHSCTIPEDEKKPELCHMAIEAGLMVLCQAATAMERKPDTRPKTNIVDLDGSPAQAGAMAGLNGMRPNIAPEPAQPKSEAANRLNSKSHKVRNALKKKMAGAVPVALGLIRTQEARRGPPAAANLQKKIPPRKNQKRVFELGDDEDDNILEQENLGIALREMQLQKDALEAACQAVAAVQRLEAEFLATPEDERTQVQYDALAAAYDNARMQLALESHHADLAKTAMSQAQNLSLGARAPNPTLNIAMRQQAELNAGPVTQIALKPGAVESVASPEAGEKPTAPRDAPQPAGRLMADTPQ